MKHLLVTNDFPPKVGGIQSYLWELWRRLPPEDVIVMTTSYPGAEAWDADQAFRVVRHPASVLVPTRRLAARVRALASETGARAVLLDPALPLGMIGPRLSRPFGIVLHGAEVTVPGRLPIIRGRLSRVLSEAAFVVAAGGYPKAEAERAAGRPLRSITVPPGVDTDRFRPLSDDQRRAVRLELGLDPDALLVVSVSRLVPRKGMDVLIRAAASLRGRFDRLHVAIAGSGRDQGRLERMVQRLAAPVTLLGRVDQARLPGVYGCADLFAMLCRNRWAGLEQEGFGIVFLEAAAAGVPQLAGDSGGAAEAVADGETGFVVAEPASTSRVAERLAVLLRDADLRKRMGAASRRRVEQRFSYDRLAAELRQGLEKAASELGL